MIYDEETKTAHQVDVLENAKDYQHGANHRAIRHTVWQSPRRGLQCVCLGFNGIFK